ncbi:MAG: thiopeptide-type bacteriocin biosynthesis protein, partial [Anaerolineales bacterium]|nr:thiopeptide-type bacteriocin biosynthesis protein [Anaerolineales bacterium]
MTMSPSTWLSAHLFYGKLWEDLLTQAVRPFVDDLFIQGQISQFFFIRYWERGPHIRLRLKGQPSALQNHVKPALEATFTDYFTKYPSERPSPET